MHYKLKKIQPGILLANGFNDDQYLGIQSLLKEYGIKPVIFSQENKSVKSFQYFRHTIYAEPKKGIVIKSFKNIKSQRIDNCSMLIIPGGAFSSYKLVSDNEVIAQLQEFYRQKKPIAAISQAARILLELPGLKDHMVTSAPLYKDAFTKKGAIWLDTPLAIDKAFQTAQNPADLPVFLEALRTRLHKLEAGNKLISKVSDK